MGGLMRNLDIRKPIVMSSAYKLIPNVYSLDKVGAGHDGVVYRYGDLVFKVLKYDISERKAKDLMTFEKATYFVHNLHLKRVAQPIDILLDSDGVYTGYVMKFFDDVTKDKESPYYQTTGEYQMRDLHHSIDELEEDVSSLSDQKVLIEDLNRGSYIYTRNHMIMCDMDKFRIIQSPSSARDLNKGSLNFFISKSLYYEMEKSGLFTKDELKQLIRWVKRSSNSRSFLEEIRKDCKSNPNYPIGEYAKEKGKLLVR